MQLLIYFQKLGLNKSYINSSTSITLYKCSICSLF